MDAIQQDMLNALNEFTIRIVRSIEQEDAGRYSEEHSTWLWTLQKVKEELLTHNEPPLVVVERLQKRLGKYAAQNDVFEPCAEIIDMFLCTVL